MPVSELMATAAARLEHSSGITQKEAVHSFIPKFTKTGNIRVSCFSMLGFDRTSFSKSFVDSPSEGMGKFPRGNEFRFGDPFVGWYRWTKSSRIVKLGIVWTYPVTNAKQSGSLHVLLSPRLLWRYVDYTGIL
jgi:hypothetical protein